MRPLGEGAVKGACSHVTLTASTLLEAAMVADLPQLVREGAELSARMEVERDMHGRLVGRLTATLLEGAAPEVLELESPATWHDHARMALLPGWLARAVDAVLGPPQVLRRRLTVKLLVLPRGEPLLPPRRATELPWGQVESIQVTPTRRAP